MARRLKACAAILLLPLCLGSTFALFRVLRAASAADTIWVAMLAGAACWIVVYLLLPKPMWIYVFGHELTHVLWTWIFWGRVRRFKATSKGGQVVVTKTNFVIALAPYFFPIYAVGAVVFFSVGDLIWGWSRYVVYFHLLIGAAYSFHATLTWHVLRSPQSDLAQQGYLFSVAVIWLTNVVVLLLGLALLTDKVELATALGWCWAETGGIFRRLGLNL